MTKICDMVKEFKELMQYTGTEEKWLRGCAEKD